MGDVQQCVTQEKGTPESGPQPTTGKLRPRGDEGDDELRSFMANVAIKEQHRRMLQQGQRIRDLLDNVASSRPGPPPAPAPPPRPWISEPW